MKRTPLTLEEHRALGKRIKAIRAELLNIAIGLQRNYSKAVCKGLFTALDKLDSARCTLDDVVCAEHRDLPQDQSKQLTRIYYGPDEESS